MSGVRVQHLTGRSCTMTVVDGSRPYRAPLVCAARIVVRGELVPCGREHVHKTYHLTLDEVGAVIVSETIWQRLALRLLAGGFRLANEVAEPPAQLVRIPALAVLARATTPGGLRAT